MDGLVGLFLYITSLFSLAAFKILSLSLTLNNLIITCLSVALFGFNLFWVFWALWIWVFISPSRFGKSSAIIAVNVLSVPFSFSSSRKEILWVLFFFFFIVSHKSHVCAELLQSCPTLCNHMDDSPPGSSVHGILQARVLEWVAMASSMGYFQPRDQTHISFVSCIGRWFFTTSASWEAPISPIDFLYSFSFFFLCDPLTGSFPVSYPPGY